MLRFQPDGFWQAIARPLVLADPSGGVYFELPAPDLRFAMLLLAAGVAGATVRGRSQLGARWRAQAGALLALFIAWTATTGNGRYFLPGLLLVGPLLVAAICALPATRAMRASLVALALALQIGTVAQNFSPGQWALAEWRDAGPGLLLPPDAERPPEPAVFLTLTSISYSMLVPQFDPRSRWANIAGQVDITTDRFERRALDAMLSGPLPRYLVLPTMPMRPTPGLQPPPGLRALGERTLAGHGLGLAPQACRLIVSRLVAVQARSSADAEPVPMGFWFCPVEGRGPAAPVPAGGVAPALLRQAADALEQRCPRWFPPGSANERWDGHLLSRQYPLSDMRVLVAEGEGVWLRHMRALNPSPVGSIEDVAAGRFALDCRTMPGRYQFPWERG